MLPLHEDAGEGSEFNHKTLLQHQSTLLATTKKPIVNSLIPLYQSVHCVRFISNALKSA